MNHPKREEWMPYLFGEAKAELNHELQAHLRDCPECREQLDTWKRSLRRLDSWKLPSVSRPALSFFPLAKWAVAAGLVLGLGFGLGHFTTSRADFERVGVQVEQNLRQQLRQEMIQLVREEVNRATTVTLAEAGKQTVHAVSELAAAMEAKGTRESQAVSAALEKLEDQHLSDFVSLKRDLDTVAVNTDSGLRQTERQLAHLADHRPAAREDTRRNEPAYKN